LLNQSVVFLAFAELQTDMSEIAGDISGTGGIPFRSYSSFCMSVLFPGASPEYDPVIRGMEVCPLYSGLLLYKPFFQIYNYLNIYNLCDSCSWNVEEVLWEETSF